MKIEKLMARWAAIALSSALLITGMNYPVHAKNKINRTEFKQVESFKYSDGEEESQNEQHISSSLPEKVDLRERGVVTPVKLQDPFGTCWAFGAIAASETSILSDMGKTYQETGLDLSEKHLAWFMYTALDDPYSSQNGEGYSYHFPVSDKTKYNYGGMRFFGSAAFSQGVGPALEADYPYQGKTKMISRILDDEGSLKSYCYSPYDDWSIDSSQRFKQEYSLRESIIYYSYAYEEDDGSISYDERVLEDIKKQINLGKGVAVGYCADCSEPGEEGSQEYMNREHWCQYTDVSYGANHEVCIVGYDDNYPKENFNEDHQPRKDGAFLVKNSWGSGESEFPNRGDADWGIVENGVHTGYFWLSYYDLSIEDFEIFNYDLKNNAKETTIIDQYDYAACNGTNTYETKKSSQMANVFTAEYNQELRDISCITAQPNVTVNYKVYVIGDTVDDLTYKALASSFTKTYDYPGYHKESLRKGVKLSKGQKYMILVEETNEDGKNEIILPYQSSNNDSTIDNFYNLYSNIIVNAGESYLQYDGEWYDWKEVKRTFNNYASHGFQLDNFSIKGYSVLLDSTDVSDLKVTLSCTSYIYDGSAKEPQVSINGLTEGKDYTVSYASNLKVGTATATIKGNGKFTGTNTVSFSIVNKKSEAASTTKAKAPTTATNVTASKINKLTRGRKSLLVKWKKIAGINGYQLQYSKYKSMKKAKSLTIKSASSSQKKISKLAAKKKYYVRIRTYKIINGKPYYSKWSPVKGAKTK